MASRTLAERSLAWDRDWDASMEMETRSLVIGKRDAPSPAVSRHREGAREGLGRVTVPVPHQSLIRRAEPEAVGKAPRGFAPPSARAPAPGAAAGSSVEQVVR
jgi:hypothetical protein